MIFPFFYFLSISTPIFSVSATVCTISGSGVVDIDSYRKSGSYTTYTTINIGTDITSIGNSCFSYSTALAEVNFESPSKLTSLGQSLFDTCTSLRSITLPDSVTTIGPYLLRACPVTSFYIGPKVQSIGIPIAYGSSSFVGFDVHNDNPNYSNDSFGALYNKDKSILYIVPCGCSTNFNIPSTVTELYSHCFHGLITIKSIYIPNTVSILNLRIGEHNYYTKTIVFQEGIQLQTLPSSVFQNWVALTKIELPESVTSIPDETFRGCTNLQYIYIPSTVINISSSAFTSCNSLKNINISSDNDNFASIDSIIYSKDKTKMIIVPTSIEDATIPKECITIHR